MKFRIMEITGACRKDVKLVVKMKIKDVKNKNDVIMIIITNIKNGLKPSRTVIAKEEYLFYLINFMLIIY